MWKWIKKHKGLTILACVALVGAGGFFYLRHAADEAMAALAELSEETAFVERRSIQSTISSTGHIMSDSTKAVSTTLTGIEVLTMHVEVGDLVQVGDVICTFDTSDIEEGISEAEDILSAAKTQSGVTVDNARRGLEMAVETQNYQIEAAARAVLNAHNAWMAASEAYGDVSNKVSDASNRMQQAQDAKNSLTIPPDYTQSADYQTLKQNADTAQQEYAKAVADLEALKLTGSADPDALAAAEAEVVNKTAVLNAAKAALDAQTDYAASLAYQSQLEQYEAAYQSAKANYDALQSSLATAENSLRSAKIAYDNAVSTYDYTVASQLSQYEGSKDALRSAKAGAGVSTISQENNLENYREQLDKGVLRASIPGTVTAVNIEEGDMYTGGPVVTIQDTGEMVVSAEIDEYDIADVKLGMRAVFKTDSTRDEQLEGTVVFIAPTPTAGSDVTYQVKVAIQSDTSRLRLGMNAKLNIILDETGEVLTVPYDAVQQDEAGNDVVYSVERSEDGTVTRTAIPVTVGVEGDYYVEVTGNIAEGMEIVMPSDEVDFMARMEEMRENMMG